MICGMGLNSQSTTVPSPLGAARKRLSGEKSSFQQGGARLVMLNRLWWVSASQMKISPGVERSYRFRHAADAIKRPSRLNTAELMMLNECPLNSPSWIRFSTSQISMRPF